jgi:hypothetical protein
VREFNNAAPAVLDFSLSPSALEKIVQFLRVNEGPAECGARLVKSAPKVDVVPRSDLGRDLLGTEVEVVLNWGDMARITKCCQAKIKDQPTPRVVPFHIKAGLETAT